MSKFLTFIKKKKNISQTQCHLLQKESLNYCIELIYVIFQHYLYFQLEDTDYDKPLDPDDVHLPAPALPTERLLAAVEQFYCPPTHERTRNKYLVFSF